MHAGVAEWKTHWTQNPARANLVGVQIPPPAPYAYKGMNEDKNHTC